MPVIPSVRQKQSNGEYAVALPNVLTQSYLFLPERQYHEKIVVLSTLTNAAERLTRVSQLISNLSYPHHLISVHFGDDGSTDDTAELARHLAQKLVLEKGFKKATVYAIHTGRIKVHREDRNKSVANVLEHKHVARARNLLTEYGISDNTWLLWVDSHMISFAHDIIQQFLFADKDLMTASCLTSRRFYHDKSTFREFWDEGHQYRTWLYDLRGEGRYVPIHSLGGCIFMIRAYCFRQGLRFPTSYYENGYDYQDTEGLAKAAKDMGFSVYGLPFVEVTHY